MSASASQQSSTDPSAAVSPNGNSGELVIASNWCLLFCAPAALEAAGYLVERAAALRHLEPIQRTAEACRLVEAAERLFPARPEGLDQLTERVYGAWLSLQCAKEVCWRTVVYSDWQHRLVKDPLYWFQEALERVHDCADFALQAGVVDLATTLLADGEHDQDLSILFSCARLLGDTGPSVSYDV